MQVETKKGLVLLGMCVFCTVVVWSLGPIAQDEEYHKFADTVEWYGIPNGLNVFSNLAFVGTALLGCWTLLFKESVFRKQGECARSAFATSPPLCR
jgi:hypothetical protein